MSRHILKFTFLHLLTSLCFYSYSQVITTVAGPGLCDGSPAVNAVLNCPVGLLVDRNNDLLVADYWGNKIYKISPSGILTTFAGNGGVRIVNSLGLGDEGDGNPYYSPDVRILEPVWVCEGPNKSYFMVDVARIRKIDSNGIISWYGGASSCFADLNGVPATSTALYANCVAADKKGNVYLNDAFSGKIRRIDTFGIIDNWDTSVTNIRSIVFDHNGNMFYCDGQTVVKKDTSGLKTTVAGTGASGFSGDGGPATSATLYAPISIAIGKYGAIYIVDYGNHRIRMVDTSGVISTIAGNGVEGHGGDGGPAILAKMYMWGIAVDSSGNVYVSGGFLDPCIRKIGTDGIISTIAGIPGSAYCGGISGTATQAQFVGLTAVLSDNQGGFYVADTVHHVVHKVDASGNIHVFAGSGIGGYSGDGGPAALAQISSPTDLAKDTRGNIFIVDRAASSVRKVSPSGIITTVAGTGMPGAYPGDGGIATATPLLQPFKMTCDKFNNLYVTDQGAYSVRKVDTTGIITTVAGTGVNGLGCNDCPATTSDLDDPKGIAVDDSLNLYLLDGYWFAKINSSGYIKRLAGEAPMAGACDGDGGLYTSAPIFLRSIAVDKVGRIYFGGRSTIRMVDTTGIISSIVGRCDELGFTGDSGDAILAHIAVATSLSVDDKGLYFVDHLNNRIRHVNFSGAEGVTASQARGISLTVIPNPFDSRILVLTNGESGSFYLIDGIGKMVTPKFQLTQSMHEQTYDIGSLTPGAYFLVVFDKNGNYEKAVPLIKK